jgi:hypothetical protein
METSTLVKALQEKPTAQIVEGGVVGDYPRQIIEFGPNENDVKQKRGSVSLSDSPWPSACSPEKYRVQKEVSGDRLLCEQKTQKGPFDANTIQTGIIQALTVMTKWNADLLRRHMEVGHVDEEYLTKFIPEICNHCHRTLEKVK